MSEFWNSVTRDVADLTDDEHKDRLLHFQQLVDEENRKQWSKEKQRQRENINVMGHKHALERDKKRKEKERNASLIRAQLEQDKTLRELEVRQRQLNESDILGQELGECKAALDKLTTENAGLRDIANQTIKMMEAEKKGSGSKRKKTRGKKTRGKKTRGKKTRGKKTRGKKTRGKKTGGTRKR